MQRPRRGQPPSTPNTQGSASPLHKQPLRARMIPRFHRRGGRARAVYRGSDLFVLPRVREPNKKKGTTKRIANERERGGKTRKPARSAGVSEKHTQHSAPTWLRESSLAERAALVQKLSSETVKTPAAPGTQKASVPTLFGACQAKYRVGSKTHDGPREKSAECKPDQRQMKGEKRRRESEARPRPPHPLAPQDTLRGEAKKISHQVCAGSASTLSMCRPAAAIFFPRARPFALLFPSPRP